MSEYLSTQLLECNRLHSEEAKSGNDSNNALFTNKLGNGVNLKVGDIVSVHAAFISEVGAAQDTIEFKGDSLGKIREFDVSNVSNTLPYAENDPNKRINGFKRTSIKIKTEKRELFDNKASIKIGFYLNSMGQNTLQLPRQFLPNGSANFTRTDSIANGLPYFNRLVYVPSDYKSYLGSLTILKQRIDNTRFTLFARENSVFDKDSDFNSSATDNIWMKYGSQTSPVHDASLIRQVSFWDYQEFSELIDLEVEPGFNSALNIAETLTDQLKRPLKENVYTRKVFNDSNEIYTPVSRTIESATYKPFNSAAITRMNAQNHAHFINESVSASQTSQESYDYLNNFQYVGYKRPQIQTTGRNLPRPQGLDGPGGPVGMGMSIHETILKTNASTSPIVIKMEYNASNCKLFDDFFKATALYPELWDNLDPKGAGDGSGDGYNRDSINVENSRWLHLNQVGNASYLANGYPYSFLGSDNCTITAQNILVDAPPIFFEYDDSTKDVFFKSPNTDKLSYGCMDRVKISDVYYIKFYPEKVGGIPGLFFTETSGGVPAILSGTDDGLDISRKIGFDLSFQAWSTLALVPFAGYNDSGFEGQWEPGYQEIDLTNFAVTNIAKDLSQVYLGSVSPLISYDQISNRFKLSKLHTLLRQQQTFIAGRPNPAINDIGAGVAGSEVFKLNPIDDFWLYTPDLMPMKGSLKHSSGAKDASYSQLNMNLEPWLVYDSYCGIYIDDFGFDSNEGLWSVLGFTQSQFNNTLTPENTLATNRIDNINKYKLNRVTTNAEITSKDYPAFIQNQYGANMFTQQIVSSMGVIENDVAHLGVNVFAPVTIAQTSIEIVARNLPRKMLRPYYLLKSSIIDYNSLIGSRDSGQNFNIAAIIDKQYSGGDFFFFTANAIQFTVTKPMTFTSITNSIHDPDGSFSTVNEDSSIIYKIEKTKNIEDLDVVNRILNKGKK